jgi:hypothetical protein
VDLSPKKHPNESAINEDILLRYLTFYCNVSHLIEKEFKVDQIEGKNAKSWLTDPIPHKKGALYFDFFDHVSLTSTQR